MGYIVPDGGKLIPAGDREAVDQVLRLLERAFDCPTSESHGYLGLQSGQSDSQWLQIDDDGQTTCRRESKYLWTATFGAMNRQANEIQHDCYRPTGYESRLT